MQCKLCGSEKVNIINTKIRNIDSDKIKVYKCNDCGVHFLYPYYDEIKLENYYNGIYRKEYTQEDYYNKNQIKEFFDKSLPEAKKRVDRIKKYLKKEDKILEVGCSSGYFLHTIKNSVNSVYGTEWDERNASYCKNNNIQVKKNPEEFNIKFNKIFMFHVLEHIKDPIHFLKKLKNCLSDEGMLFIEVPNNEDILLSIYDIPEFRDFYYQSAHIWYFNKKSLGILLNKSGYKFSILGIQRYDISNHIYWLKNRMPGGNKFFNNIFSQDLNKTYEKNLKEKGTTDTLFAVCYRNEDSL